MAGYDFGFGNLGVDEDDETNEESHQFQGALTGRDGLIFLIDCTKEMFDTSADERPFDICIKCLKTTLQNKIVSSEKDLVGVVFFGTKQSNGDFDNIYIYQELDQPGAQRILDLEKMMEAGVKTFLADYGHSDIYSLSHALWTCSNMFSKCRQKINFKRVLLFTNNDNPHSNNPQLKTQTKTKANDLHENGIDLELMHLQPPGEKFDSNKFYKDLTFTSNDDSTNLPDPAVRLEELLTRVRAKDHKKRALCKLPFSLADGFDMSVGVYNLVGTCPKPHPVKLLKKSNEELKPKSTTYIVETGEALGPDELKKSQTHGGRKISFELDELKQVKSFDSPGLVLMGFKPASKLKRYFHVKHAQFLYPDETNILGSSTLFTAMLRRCIDRNVVPVCRYIPRKNTPPTFVILLPQEEECDECKVQVTPPGFHLIPLPFADDFRQIHVSDAPKANSEQINKAKELIKKLQFTYSSDAFENPVLQQYWRNIEALALDRDEPDDWADLTLPDPEATEKRAGHLIAEFKDLVFPDNYDPRVKRKVTSAANSGVKRARMDEGGSVDVGEEVRQGRLGKLTVPILKDFVKKQNIATNTFKKADLISAIEAHFNS